MPCDFHTSNTLGTWLYDYLVKLRVVLQLAGFISHGSYPGGLGQRGIIGRTSEMQNTCNLPFQCRQYGPHY